MACFQWNGNSKKQQPSDKIYSLTDFNFSPFLNTTETVLVMFYDPTDAKSFAISKQFAQAAGVTRRKNHAYAAVDCFKFGYLCSKQNAQDTPMFTLFSNGYKLKTVKGTRSFNSPAMLAAVESAKVLTEPLDEDQSRC